MPLDRETMELEVLSKSIRSGTFFISSSAISLAIFFLSGLLATTDVKGTNQPLPNAPWKNGLSTGHTPQDPSEPIISRLRLIRIKHQPFNIEFKDYETLNGEFYFKFYVKGLPEKRQPGWKKTGETLGFGDFVVGNYKENIVSETDPTTHITSQVDKSILQIDNSTSGRSVTLPFRETVDSPDSPVCFVLLTPQEEKNQIWVRRNQTFSIFLPEIEKSNPYAGFSRMVDEYELLDAKDTGAVICDPKTSHHLFIPALRASEHVLPSNGGLGVVVDDDEVAKREAGHALKASNAPGQVYSWTYNQNGQSYRWSPIGADAVALDYEGGNHGLPKDSIEAMIWHLRAAAHGDPEAQESLGGVFKNGGFSHENMQTGYLVCDDSIVRDDWLSSYWYGLAFPDSRTR
jgi:hypothetical protein